MLPENKHLLKANRINWDAEDCQARCKCGKYPTLKETRGIRNVFPFGYKCPTCSRKD
jgi:hypothetical protein